MAAQAFFYPREALSRLQLVQLVQGNPPELDLDVVEFADEAGGTGERELAIPFLPDMDEVVVDSAELQFAALRFEHAIEGYSVTNASGDEAGIVLSLERPGRLLKVVIDALVPPGRRLIVRSAEPKPAGGFSFGPPIFASPPFELDSPLYAPVLGGLSVAVVGGRSQLTFPGTAGSGWLIQLATGDEAAELVPVPFSTTVHSVTIDAAARDLTLVVPGAPDTLLWSNANALLREAGTQVASFTPVAQKRLAAALDAAADVTLPVPLRFTATTSGRIAITSKTLQAHYRVHALGGAPVQAALNGGWTSLTLSAPAGRQPSRGTLRLVAKHRGRALNDGSPVPPLEPLSSGVRVDAGRTTAAPAPFAPLAGEPAGSLLELVAVCLPMRAVGDAEVALEVRADAAGAPGAVLAPPVVRQLAPGDPVWTQFELAAPLPLATGGAPLWVTLRMTKGELHWFADGDGAARASADGGQTWGEVEPRLHSGAAPLVQLFHRLPEPLRPPLLELRLAGSPLAALALAGPAAGDPHEFSEPAPAIAPGFLQALGHTGGSGRVPSELLVFSRAVADLTIAELTLDYDPGGA